MEALIEEMEGLERVGTVRLRVYDHNAPARALYESLDFMETPKTGRADIVNGTP